MVFVVEILTDVSLMSIRSRQTNFAVLSVCKCMTESEMRRNNAFLKMSFFDKSCVKVYLLDIEEKIIPICFL